MSVLVLGLLILTFAALIAGGGAILFFVGSLNDRDDPRSARLPDDDP